MQLVTFNEKKCSDLWKNFNIFQRKTKQFRFGLSCAFYSKHNNLYCWFFSSFCSWVWLDLHYFWKKHLQKVSWRVCASAATATAAAVVDRWSCFFFALSFINIIIFFRVWMREGDKKSEKSNTTERQLSLQTMCRACIQFFHVIPCKWFWFLLSLLAKW